MIDQHSTRWWTESTSFIVFESDHSIGSLMADCKKAIAPSHDLVLMRMMDTKSAFIAGKVDDDDIFKLMDYLKKV